MLETRPSNPAPRRNARPKDSACSASPSGREPRVYLLLNQHGRVSSVNASREEAQAKADRFNADPHLEPGTPDADAPYTVEAWSVR